MNVRRQGNLLYFEKELWLTIFGGVMSSVIAAAMFFYIERIVGVITPVTKDIPLPLAIACTPVFGLVFAAVLRACGPNRLCVDTQARRYRLVAGFPFFPSRISGPLEDFTAVRLSVVPSRYGDTYNIVLARRGPGPKKFLATEKYNLPAAQAKAKELAALLGVPFQGENPL